MKTHELDFNFLKNEINKIITAADDEVTYVITSPVRITLRLDENDIINKLDSYYFIGDESEWINEDEDITEDSYNESVEDFNNNVDQIKDDYESWAETYTDYIDDYDYIPVNEELKNLDLAEYIDDDLKSIVKSITVELDSENSKAYTTIKCNKELTSDELNRIEDYIEGQFADGWGEGFEQQDFKTNSTVEFNFNFTLPDGSYENVYEDIDVEYFNIHFWKSDFQFNIIEQ